VKCGFDTAPYGWTLMGAILAAQLGPPNIHCIFGTAGGRSHLLCEILLDELVYDYGDDHLRH
jgi:hypothetical protein